MRAQVHSEKHYTQMSLVNTTAGNVTTDTLAKGVVAPVSGSREVRIGSIIKAIYIELWIRGSDAGVGSTYVISVEKTPSDGIAPTSTNMGALHAYPNKKNVFFTSMGLINDDTGVAVPVLRQWIKIPKGKQRFGLDDRLRFNFFAQTGSHDRCGIVVYKEYY